MPFGNFMVRLDLHTAPVVSLKASPAYPKSLLSAVQGLT